MPAGEEYAVKIRPDDNALGNTLTNIFNKRDALKAAKLAKEEADALKKKKEQDELTLEEQRTQKLIDDKASESGIATGDADQDAMVRSGIRGAKAAATAELVRQRKLGIIDQVGITRGMDGALNAANDRLGKSKSTMAWVDETLKNYATSKSINLEALRKRIISKVFTNGIDPDTKEVIYKDTKDIKPVDIQQALMEDAEGLVLKDEAGNYVKKDVTDALEKETGTVGVQTANQEVTLRNGKKLKNNVNLSVNMKPGQEIYWDEYQDNKVDPKLRWKTESVVEEEGGEEIKMLNKESYDRYYGSPGGKAYLKAQAIKHNKAIGGKPIDFTTAHGERMLRAAALEDLKGDVAGTYVNWQTKEDQVNFGGGGQSQEQKDAKSDEKDFQKAMKSAPGTLIQIMTGKLKPTSSKLNTATGRYDVTNLLAGGKLMGSRVEAATGNTVPQAYERVEVDKDDGSIWVKEDASSTARRISPFERHDFLREIAQVNGVDVDMIEKMYEKNFGKYDDETSKDAGHADRINAHKVFRETGDPKSLRKQYVGRYFDVNGTKVQLQDLIRTKKAADRKDDVYKIIYLSGGKPIELDDLTRSQVISWTDNEK